MSHGSPLGHHLSSASDLKARIEAERRGLPFLLYRDEAGSQRIVDLSGGSVMTLGRRLENDIALEWDAEVSRVHARLEHVGGDWTIVDDGFSRNGSWVNGERVTARRRLRDGDALRIGNTVLAFVQPGERESDATTPAAAQGVTRADITDTQRSILIALARPFKDPHGLALPATNKEIADEVYLSVDAVKGHLRTLFAKFGVGDLPQNKKRAQLVWLAFRSGVISAANLWD
ncbi:MAG TPA: FHA domain-containing protein [Thermoleophilaceae bacterium]|jgi:DNA-binding CsgD family transcriptional regulator|nr:FHA domain-containing protein [Thermoleophilaceae bacterium]